MSLFQELSILAFHQLLGDRGQSLMKFVHDRLSAHDSRLEEVLHLANERAWRTLEVALVGPSWLSSLTTTSEEKNLQQQIRHFLHALPAPDLGGDATKFRKLAHSELASARKVKLIPGHLADRTSLANAVRGFERYSEREKIIQRDREALASMAEMLRKEKYEYLAQYIALRPTGGQPLLVQAVGYFFRAEVSRDEQLSTGLMMDRLEGLDSTFDAGFAQLHQAMHTQGDQLYDRLASSLAQIDGKVSDNLEVSKDTNQKVESLQGELASLKALLQQLIAQQPAPQATPSATQTPSVTQTPQSVEPSVAPVSTTESFEQSQAKTQEQLEEPAPIGHSAPVVRGSLASPLAGKTLTSWQQVQELLKQARKVAPQQTAKLVEQLDATTRKALTTEPAPVALPIYPEATPIADALPVDEPQQQPKKMLGSAFSKPKQASAAQEKPTEMQDQAEKPAETKKHPFISPLFKPRKKDG